MTNDLQNKTIKFCSGTGQYHTNEIDPNKPGKKLTPYLEIDLSAVLAMIETPCNVDKTQAQWLIPSTLLSRNFKTQESEGEYWMMWLDLDENPPVLDELAEALDKILGDCCFYLYTSKSATQTNQKLRALIPLGAPLSGADWVLCQQILNDALKAKGITPDRATERTAQLCYLPNRGEFYDYLINDGEAFKPLEVFADEIAAKKLAIVRGEEAVQERRAKAAQRKAELKYTGGEMRDLIDAFNTAHTVEDILLKAHYTQRGKSFCHPNSASGSYSANIDPATGRVNALSSSDPLYNNGQGAHDAFSAFTVLFHGGE